MLHLSAEPSSRNPADVWYLLAGQALQTISVKACCHRLLGKKMNAFAEWFVVQRKGKAHLVLTICENHIKKGYIISLVPSAGRWS